MADYRELSQQYAQGAIKAAMALNGGAAVALLTQLSSLWNTPLFPSLRIAMAMWAIGTGLAGFAWVFGFVSTRYVDRSIEAHAMGEKDANLSVSNVYMHIGTAAVALSLLLFLAGGLLLAFCGKVR